MLRNIDTINNFYIPSNFLWQVVPQFHGCIRHYLSSNCAKPHNKVSSSASTCLSSVRVSLKLMKLTFSFALFNSQSLVLQNVTIQGNKSIKYINQHCVNICQILKFNYFLTFDMARCSRNIIFTCCPLLTAVQFVSKRSIITRCENQIL